MREEPLENPHNCDWVDSQGQCWRMGTIAPAGSKFFCSWHYECLLNKDFPKNKELQEIYKKRIDLYQKQKVITHLDYTDEMQIKGVALIKEVAPKLYDEIIKQEPRFSDSKIECKSTLFQSDIPEDPFS